MSTRALNVLHVCDHLGWEGSRMHGVKRLFAWMLPRFDPSRFKVSLVSLRRKDLSEETLESLGVDISYLHRSRFDPATLTALLKIVDRRSIDVLHLHGYGATTFGRAAAALRRLPTVLHEHANLTDTPWFQKVADRARMTNSAVLFETARAMSVKGSSARSATFWNQGVSVRFACS
jgi:Glycosyltransferase Family 4